MAQEIGIPIPSSLFVELAAFLREKGDPREPVDVIINAIHYWMDNADWKPELLAPSQARGYQWKGLFLPDGTEIRMPYKGEYFYAKVEGDQIIFKGAAVTPGSLVNTIANSSRNAWHDLWIKRPSDTQWQLADDCRQRDGEGSNS